MGVFLALAVAVLLAALPARAQAPLPPPPAEAPFVLTLRDAPTPLTALPQWQEAALANGWQGIDCGWLQEMRNVTLCLFGRADIIALVFGRVTAWVEQPGFPVVPASAVSVPFETRPPVAVNGANLTGRDILAFAEVVQAACASGEEEACFTDWERPFFERFLLPAARRTPDMAIIAAGAAPGQEGTLSHELLHGLFYSDHAMQTATWFMWTQVLGPDARRGITASLGQVYKPHDLTILVNEFQAHMLDCKNAPLMRRWRERYGAAFHAVLADWGVTVPLGCGGNE